MISKVSSRSKIQNNLQWNDTFPYGADECNGNSRKREKYGKVLSSVVDDGTAHQCFVFPVEHGRLPCSLSWKWGVASSDQNVLSKCDICYFWATAFNHQRLLSLCPFPLTPQPATSWKDERLDPGVKISGSEATALMWDGLALSEEINLYSFRPLRLRSWYCSISPTLPRSQG